MMELCLKMVSLGGMVLTVVFFSTLTDGATFWSTDPCPEGVSSGESWEPDVIPGTKTAAVCMKCDCFKPGRGGGFSCYSCGVAVPGQPSPACYFTKDADLPYPQCCQIVERCPGDDGYNPTLAIANGGIVG